MHTGNPSAYGLKNAIRNQPIWGNKFIMFRSETLFFKSLINEGIVMIKPLKLRDGKLDINYIANVVKDKRNFYEINILNILQNALNQAKVDISIDPTLDFDIPIYTFIILMKYTIGVFKDPNAFIYICWKT